MVRILHKVINFIYCSGTMKKIHESDIEELARRKLEGESYSTIRRELRERGQTDEEIRMTIRTIDEKVLYSEMNQRQTVKLKQWYRGGLFLAVLGLLLSVGATRGIILGGIPRWVVYAPFFLGILLMVYGRYAPQKPASPPDRGPGPIRRKRPYK
jgi:hypothetical protein